MPVPTRRLAPLVRDAAGGQNGRVKASTPAVAAVIRSGTAHQVHEIGHDPAVTAFGQEAAAALGVEPGRVFKTLVASVDGELVVAVVPVRGELNLKALAAASGAKSAEMADPGGIEPFHGSGLGACCGASPGLTGQRPKPARPGPGVWPPPP